MKRLLLVAGIVLVSVLWSFVCFVDFLQKAAIEREVQLADQGSTIPSFPRRIPRCDRELWERITDGCPEETTDD